MRICRFNNDRLGLVQDNAVLDVTDALDILPPTRYPLPRSDPMIANLSAICARIEKLARSSVRFDIANVSLLSPVANPGKIVAAPVNYREHVEEAIADPAIHHQTSVLAIQRVGLFLKATSSLVGAAEGVTIRHNDRRTDHEVELAVIIGARCNRVSRANALRFVAGYCIGLDITVRGPEERSLRKSIDGYTVLGPWLVTSDEIPDPANLSLSIDVNDQRRQEANTRDLIMGIPELLEFASSYYTLHPGDVLLTGTPAGVGPIKPGDQMTASIDDIGSMRVPVLREIESTNA